MHKHNPSPLSPCRLLLSPAVSSPPLYPFISSMFINANLVNHTRIHTITHSLSLSLYFFSLFLIVSSTMRTPVGERFSEFYESWISQLDVYSKQLVQASKEGASLTEQRSLISSVSIHHKEYYSVKWAAAREDVLPFFYPFWLSKLENAYAWITGWKPSTMIRLVESMKKAGAPGPTLVGLTEEQLAKIEKLRVKIKVEEERVERDMERQQVAVADRRIVELVRLGNRAKNGEAVGQVEVLVEAAVNGVLAGLEKVMKSADVVRLKALKGILDILNPSQSVDFLAASCMLQLQVRQWGKSRDKREQEVQVQVQV